MRVLAVVCAALVAVATAAAVPLPGIRTPTRNIRCIYAARTDARNPGDLFCTIGTASYAAALQARCLGPNDQGVDWHGFMLPQRGPARIVCTGGALWFGTPRYVILAFGRRWRAGGFTCRSAVTGLTCTRGAHGLFLSRETWRAW
jgi:hypothetical protein